MVRSGSVNIDRIAFIGRTYFEYLRLFNLSEPDLERGPVLDCPAGPSSFTAEASALGFEAVACDVLYGLPPRSLHAKGEEDVEHVFQKVDGVPHLYVWKYYKNRDEIIALRQKALKLFIADYSVNQDGRYVQAELPHLPFRDGEFPLVLSSHFLFLYGDRLSVDFHTACIREMVRVCSGEVRIYPLQGLDANPYPQLDKVIEILAAGNIRAEIVEVPFEFQRGSNRMLKLKRQGAQ